MTHLESALGTILLGAIVFLAFAFGHANAATGATTPDHWPEIVMAVVIGAELALGLKLLADRMFAIRSQFLFEEDGE
jgi:hypothetical protein